jgi:glutathione S-transferase
MRSCRSASRPPDALILYNHPISGNCYKVRLLLAHLGVPYETRDVDVFDRRNPRDELGGLSPTRRLPTLVLDAGGALAESNAILWYFGEGTRFVPDARLERAKVLQWLFFEQYEHQPAIALARILKTYRETREEWDAQGEQLTRRGDKALRALDEGLRGREWLVGDGISIADVALYAYTHAAGEGGFSLEEYPQVHAWLDRVAAQPGHVTIDAR